MTNIYYTIYNIYQYKYTDNIYNIFEYINTNFYKIMKNIKSIL